MHIADIEPHLVQLKSDALTSLDLPAKVVDSIALETPPDPSMGDRGFPCFSLARHLRRAPAQIAADVADRIAARLTDEDLVAEAVAVGPYVNFRFHPGRLAALVVTEALHEDTFGAHHPAAPQHWMFEYSAPNTNKPQHLGHVRNDLLGQTVATAVAFAGHEVTRVNLINDRGIHICKSMLAYQRWGDGETPASSSTKGDHLVGRYYVLFNTRLQQEYTQWQQSDDADAAFAAWLAQRDADGAHQLDHDAARQAFFTDYADAYFNQHSELGAAARQMLRDWEAGDPDVVALWETMNRWVVAGFEETYARLGVDFDRVYYESQTYRLGKDIVERGLERGLFDTLDDGAVVCDLSPFGMDGHKVLLRSDGTSVYMTQDLGTAIARFDEFDMDHMVYVVGNEQDYHFEVLFHILGLIDPTLTGRLHHLSYGMVLLPEGKMKSREGTVVDADDLMDEMVRLARAAVVERYDALTDAEVDRRARAIGMGALKYFILDFNPRSTVNFDPQRSIDFQGRTGPYCMYSYARVQSIGRRVGGWPALDEAQRAQALHALGTDLEMAVVRELLLWPAVCARAAEQLDPSKLTEHLFKICKAFSTMYNDDAHRIKDVDDALRRDGLLLLSKAVATTLEVGLGLLGIEPLDEM